MGHHDVVWIAMINDNLGDSTSKGPRGMVSQPKEACNLHQVVAAPKWDEDAGHCIIKV